MIFAAGHRARMLCVLGGIAVSIVAFAMAAAPASAQTMTGVPNALQGFSQNRDQPVKIEAERLEVRDKEQQASFIGDVKVTQGDTVMRAKSLVVFYERNDAKAAKDAKPARTMPAADPGPGGSQKISRLEARGGVTVTQKDQTVTGQSGIFDMRANTVTLNGGVLLTQGQNVLRGERLIVDLTTGAARVEAGKSNNGRVQGVFHSTGTPLQGGNPAAPGTRPQPAPGRNAPAASDEPGAPLKLNALPPRGRAG